jgi:hypothetical protein
LGKLKERSIEVEKGTRKGGLGNLSRVEQKANSHKIVLSCGNLTRKLGGNAFRVNNLV